MTLWKILSLAVASALLSGPLGPTTARADEADKKDEVKAKPAPAGTLVVIDNAGKEHTLKEWKFVKGTEQLSFLTEPAKTDKDAKNEKDKAKEDKDKDDKKAEDKGPTGPEFLIFRDDNSTDLQDGILTYIPMNRIRAIDFDNDKRTITVRVLKFGKKDEDEEVLTGSTRYTDNKLAIEAEADLGDLGVASVKFQGGVAKGGIKGIRFAEPKVTLAEPKGRPVEVTAADKDKSVHKVTNLQPLYVLADRSQRLIPTLMFKKTVKVALPKIQKLSVVEGGEKGAASEYEVTLKDGKSHTLVLLDRTSPLDGKPARLLGFIGEVAAGYKLFPVSPSPNNVFTTIEFEGDKADTNKEDKKEDKKEETKKDKE